MGELPRASRFDATLALRRDPYRYISRRAKELRSDVFETRLLLRPTLCMTGRASAEVFYDPRRFVRHGASPEPIQKTLFGKGGVQGLDGETHAHRKRLLLSLMAPERIDALARASIAEWRRCVRRAKGHGPHSLYRIAQDVLTRTVCFWAGVPLPEAEVPRRTGELVALFDAAGARSLRRHLGARLARRRSERWAAEVIEAVRAGELLPPEDSACHRLATHRDLQGKLLDPRIAAVELLNVLRPTIAASVYVVFLAHALDDHPHHRAELQSAPEEPVQWFVQEVRRFYPFFPAVAALVRQDFEWRGYSLRTGTRALLDLYGIDHDERVWGDPERFRPERFRKWDEDPFDFVPQGGGEHERGHRCAGEWATIALMKQALRFLVDEVDYRVPPQDLRIDFERLPALPKSRFQVSELRLR